MHPLLKKILDPPLNRVRSGYEITPEPECPRKYKLLIFTSMFRQVLNPANAINSFAKSLFPFFGLDCAQKHRPRLCLPFVNLLKIEKWCPSILLANDKSTFNELKLGKVGMFERF